MNAHIPTDVIKFFGGPERTRVALKMKSRQIIYYWKKRGLMPELQARKAAEASNGHLKFDRTVYH